MFDDVFTSFSSPVFAVVMGPTIEVRIGILITDRAFLEKMTDVDMTFVALTTTFSLLSFLGACLVVYLTKLKDRPKLDFTESNLISIVGNMSCFDAAWSLWYLANFIPLIFHEQVYDPSLANESRRRVLCTALGVWVHISAMSSITWFFVIVIITYMVVDGWSDEKIIRFSRWQTVFVFLISCGTSVVVLSLNQFGSCLDFNRSVTYIFF